MNINDIIKKALESATALNVGFIKAVKEAAEEELAGPRQALENLLAAAAAIRTEGLKGGLDKTKLEKEKAGCLEIFSKMLDASNATYLECGRDKEDEPELPKALQDFLSSLEAAVERGEFKIKVKK